MVVVVGLLGHKSNIIFEYIVCQSFVVVCVLDVCSINPQNSIAISPTALIAMTVLFNSIIHLLLPSHSWICKWIHSRSCERECAYDMQKNDLVAFYWRNGIYSTRSTEWNSFEMVTSGLRSYRQKGKVALNPPSPLRRTNTFVQYFRWRPFCSWEAVGFFVIAAAAAINFQRKPISIAYAAGLLIDTFAWKLKVSCGKILRKIHFH